MLLKTIKTIASVTEKPDISTPARAVKHKIEKTIKGIPTKWVTILGRVKLEVRHKPPKRDFSSRLFYFGEVFPSAGLSIASLHWALSRS